ncbi:hypothetical protein ACIQC7_35245 [Kitasatospora sp. NPDC088556]|uniref:hypothetical protein n=1 Tax=Kitasatospora sp. NPDC088556 TaxID=3364076 RepID=UPI0037F28615
MKGFDHLGQAQELVVLGGLDLLQVPIRPPPAPAQQLEEIGVLVGERMVVDGVEHGHGGDLSIRVCWSVANGVCDNPDNAAILTAPPIASAHLAAFSGLIRVPNDTLISNDHDRLSKVLVYRLLSLVWPFEALSSQISVVSRMRLP